MTNPAEPAEPAARLRLTILGRNLTLTARPWSARLGRVEPQVSVTPIAPAPGLEEALCLDEPAPFADLLAEIDRLSGYAAASPEPIVSEGPPLHIERLSGGTPDASEWGFLRPDTARRRAERASRYGYADLLHRLAEDVADLTAAAVRHHLTPTTQTATEIERSGVVAASLILAIIRRVKA